MSRYETALLVIDVQEKVIPLVRNHERIVANVSRLVAGARILNVPILATEQYPRGLGPTVRPLAEQLDPPPEKTAFSCGGCGPAMKTLRDLGMDKVLLAGIEAHVCVQQTALDLMAYGYQVYVAVDATGSRFEIDEKIALERISLSGATLTTVESALFEWCQDSSAPEFKEISRLIRQQLP
jgi:nicotinamidase-related amidase